MIIIKKEFCNFVEEYYASTDTNMIDAVLYSCEKFNIDPEYSGSLINRSIKEKLEIDFIDINLLKTDKTYSLC